MKSTLLKILLITAASSFLSGCVSVHSEPVAAPVDIPDKFSFQGGGQIAGKWWESFEDPQLAALIEEAINENFTIRAAWDRLRQAEAIAKKAGAKLLPSADYQGGITRTRQEATNQLTGADDTTYTTSYKLGIVSSYEVDLWGRIRSTRRAAVLDADAARENLYAAAITLSANVAKSWYRLAEAGRQVELVKDQIETNEKVLSLVKARFNKGQVGASDVFRQQQLLEATRSQLNQAREDAVIFQHTLSVLTGMAPKTGWTGQEVKLVSIGELPELKVPSDSINRRPDVRRAYKSVQAADMRVAAAIADQYPSVTINPTLSTSASRAEDLFDDWVASLAANVVGPLFDADLRKAEVERTRAVLSQSINEYGQVILEALREIEDALNQEYYQRRNVRYIQQQLVMARKVYERTRQNYIKGQADYLRVLDAQESMQSLERNELTARRLLVERRIDLYRSVAGSLEMERPELARMDGEQEEK